MRGIKMAAKKLTNKDKQVIHERISAGEAVETIAKALGFPNKTVSEYLTNMFEAFGKMQAEKKVELQKAAKKPTAKDLMIMRTRDGKRKGIAVMTKEASEVADKASGRGEDLRTIESLEKQVKELKDKVSGKDTLSNDGGQAFQSRYAHCIAPATAD